MELNKHPKKKKSQPPVSKRTLLFQKCDGKCHYCGALLTGKRKWKKEGGLVATKDHVVPRAKGGSSEIDNLVLACLECNSRKRAKSYEDFIAELEQQGSTAAQQVTATRPTTAPFVPHSASVGG